MGAYTFTILHQPLKELRLLHVTAAWRAAPGRNAELLLNPFGGGGFVEPIVGLRTRSAVTMQLELDAPDRAPLRFDQQTSVRQPTVAVGGDRRLHAQATVRVHAARPGFMTGGHAHQRGHGVSLGRVLGARGTWTLLNALPIGCVGIVVSMLLGRSRHPPASLGSNLLGSVVGGCPEYRSMFVGLRALVLLALGLYLGALWLLLRRSAPSVTA